jgi:hypothetical protein
LGVPGRLSTLPARAFQRVGSGAIVVGLAAFASFVLLEADGGGFSATVWYPTGLYLLALLGVVLASYRGILSGVPRWTVGAVSALGLFTAWSFASIAWADVRGDAWDGANRTLLYFIVFVLFALLPWRVEAAVVLLALFVGATAAIGLIELLRASMADNPGSYFIGTRFASPTGYQNANAALYMVAVWPAIFLASRRELPFVLRGLMLGSAGVLVNLAVLGQSRGWLYATPVVALLFFAIVPGRIRSLIAVVSVAGAAALAWPKLSAVYDASGNTQLGSTLRDARGAIGLVSILLFIIGLAWGLIDRRVVLPRRFERRVGTVVGVAALAATIAGLVAAFAIGSASARISHSWHEFTSGVPSQGGSHFASGLGGGRYDFWRVGLLEFRNAPVGGVGVDNFALRYLSLRRTDEEPLYPHSVEVRILAGTGAIGGLLFLSFLVCSFVAVRRAWRDQGSNQFAVGVVAVLVVTSGYWWVHGSVDWFWEFPALGAPAFGWLGLAVGLAPRASGRIRNPSAGGRRYLRTFLVSVVGIVAFGLATVSFGLPWLAARDVAWASNAWPSNPVGALDRLARARRLNVLSDRPDLVAGAIASRLGRWDTMRERFEAALRRTPDNWYPYLELGALDSLEGKPARALTLLARAHALDPREPVTLDVMRRVRRGDVVRPSVLDALFLARVHERLR